MYDNFRWTSASDMRISILKEYEPLQPFFLVALASLARCGTFLDVGANVGIYSVFMSSLPAMQNIFAFEPTPATIAELRDNISLNVLEDRIQVYENAVSSMDGSAVFGIIDSISGANSIVSTTIHEASKIQREVIVKCVALDGLRIPTTLPICLKIDVEGHELAALRGAEKLLRSAQGILQLENYNPSDRSLFELLGNFGYNKITHLGPDFYYSNMPELADKGLVISAFEQAGQMMIDSNHSKPQPRPSGTRPINLKGPAGLSLQLSGPSALYARRLRKIFVAKPETELESSKNG